MYVFPNSVVVYSGFNEAEHLWQVLGDPRQSERIVLGRVAEERSRIADVEPLPAVVRDAVEYAEAQGVRRVDAGGHQPSQILVGQGDVQQTAAGLEHRAVARD